MLVATTSGDLALIEILGLAIVLGVDPEDDEEGGDPAIAIGDGACLGTIFGPFGGIFNKKTSDIDD